MGDTFFCDPNDAGAPDVGVAATASAAPSDPSSRDVTSDASSPSSTPATSSQGSTNEVAAPFGSPEPRKILAGCITAKTRTRGCVSIRLLVTADGKVVSSSVHGVEDVKTAACLEHRAAQLRFPTADGERQLDLPINCSR